METVYERYAIWLLVLKFVKLSELGAIGST